MYTGESDQSKRGREERNWDLSAGRRGTLRIRTRGIERDECRERRRPHSGSNQSGIKNTEPVLRGSGGLGQTNRRGSSRTYDAKWLGPVGPKEHVGARKGGTPWMLVVASIDALAEDITTNRQENLEVYRSTRLIEVSE
jgi:hypothetical protein